MYESAMAAKRAAMGELQGGAMLTRDVEAARQPDVIAQMEEIARALARLDEAAAALTNKLTPLQRPNSPIAGEAKNVHEVTCPLADQLRTFAGQIDRVSRGLNDHRDRLEI